MVVGSENSPTGRAHEAWGRGDTILGHLAHAGAGDKIEVLLDAAGATEELHLLVDFIVCGDLEGEDLDTVEHALAVDEELLTVPDVVKIFILLGVLDTSGVAASDEVGDTAADAGGGVPHDLGGATVVHWGRPHGEDGVLSVEGSVGEEGGVLGHALSEGNVVVLAPATEGVEEKDGVLVALLDELLTGVLEEEHVSVVERVSHLESVNGISASVDDLSLDLSGEHSVLVVAVVEDGSLGEAHGGSRNEEVSLSEDGLSAGVVLGHAAEGTGADLFLAVVEEDGVLDDGEDGVGAKGGASEGDFLLTSEGGLLFGSHVLGDRDGEEVALALFVGHGLHVHDLEEFKLVHESLEGSSPAVSDGLEVFDLVLGDVNDLKGGVLSGLSFGSSLPQGFGDGAGLVGLEDSAGVQVVQDDGLALGEGELTSVDVHLGGTGGLVWVGDTGEVGDNTSASLSVKSLNVTAFANLEGGRDVALVELKTSSLVDGSGEVSISGVGGDEGDEDDLAGHAEELGDLGDTADVLGTVAGGEAKILVETRSNDISVEEEDLLAVTDHAVNLILDGGREGGLASTGETSEPVGGTGGDGVGSSGLFGRCFDHLD